MSRVVVVLFLAAACADREPAVTTASIGDLTYGVPEGWAMRDLSQPGTTTVQWAPTDNERKQTITLVRTQPLPGLARASETQLASLLGDAQPRARGRFEAARPIRTRQGLPAVRVDGRFSPNGSERSYARSHVVIVDGDTLVHVIYTAAVPDAEVLDLVLAHAARKAG